MRYILAIMLFGLIIGCSSEQTPEIIYNLPSDYVPQVYEITSPDGFDMQMVVIQEKDPEESNYDRFLAWKQKHEAEDKYNMIRDVWENENENDFAQCEEERIEEYCKEYGFERCMNIDRTCEEDGCHKVTVECDDDFYDEGIDKFDECRRFNVEVDPDIDDDLTEITEDEVE